MAKVYLQAMGICRIEEGGTLATYYPGDWFECGKHQARQLEANGSAIIRNVDKRQMVLELNDCGILVLDGNSEGQRQAERLATQYMLEVANGPLRLPFPRTLILADCKPKARLVPVGFRWLDEGWQLAVPLVDMETLACDVGGPAERMDIANVIHDLRVPVYDTRLVFVLRCPETEAMVAQWAEERQYGHDGLSFLRALYQALVIWTPLLPSWIE